MYFSATNAPIILKTGGIMSEDDFFLFCQLNDMLALERDKNGDIILLSLPGSRIGSLNIDLTISLGSWLQKNKIAGELFGSSTGFTLPNGAVRSPDLSWISKDNWETLSSEEKEIFAPICPDFVIEIRSRSGELKYLQDKMQEYMENGCQLAWLIDVFEKQVFIYGQGNDVKIIRSLDVQLSGDPVFPGFVLDPSAIEKS